MAYANTNVFIALLVGTSHPLHEPVLSIFRRVASGELVLLVTPIIVAELVYVGRSLLRWTRRTAADRLGELLSADGLAVAEGPTIQRALRLYGDRPKLDFADAYPAARPWRSDRRPSSPWMPALMALKDSTGSLTERTALQLGALEKIRAAEDVAHSERYWRPDQVLGPERPAPDQEPRIGQAVFRPRRPGRWILLRFGGQLVDGGREERRPPLQVLAWAGGIQRITDQRHPLGERCSAPVVQEVAER